MSDERREQAWEAWSRGGGPSPETIRRVGLMYMFRGAFDSGYDARNAEVEALKAALRTARVALHSVSREPHKSGVYSRTLAPALADIDAILDPEREETA